MANIFDSESPYVINGQLWVGKNGTQIPNAGLQLGPGVAASNSSPLKFTAGTNLTTPEAGAMEFDGTHLYITIGSTRYTLDQQASAPSVPVDITGANANALSVGPNGTTNPTFNVDTSVTSDATGLNIQGQAAAGGLKLTVLSSGTNESMTLDAKGTGTIGLNTVSTTSGLVTVGNSTSLAGLAINGATTVTSASASSLVVGPNGATTPIFTVASNTGSAVAGLKITGAATGGTVAVVATDSGSNTSITIDGKGTGTVGINTIATTSGLVTIGNSTSKAGTTVNGPATVTGIVTASSGTATPAAGSTAAVLLFGTTAGFGIYYGSGAPSVSAAQGSIYLRSDGSSTSTRLYVNSTGSTTWVNFTSAS